jgi:hypothetical protein
MYETSIKLPDLFYIQLTIWTPFEKKVFGPIKGLFLFLASKTRCRTGRHEKKEKLLVFFGLRILFPIQIQLLDTGI